MDKETVYLNALKCLIPLYGQNYRTGDRIIQEGAKDPRIFFIVSGMVNIFIGEEPNKDSLRLLEEGEIFGEMALLDNLLRTASAEALTDTKAIVMNKEQFSHLIQKYPVLAMKIIEMMGMRMRKIDVLYKRAKQYQGL